ncbi:MAG TPA: hypothetical protein VD833_04315 [Vicinamibacterales bacterium]|nr:hypothetical protein [Vicinamibacterales bacterium]
MRTICTCAGPRCSRPTAKENGFLLGQGRIDFVALRQALDDIGYTGWIQIEGTIPKGQPVFESYLENVRVMRRLFGT